MSLSLSEQKRLDILIKELRLKVDCLREDVYMINPDTKAMLEVLGDVVLYLEKKSN